MKKQQKRFSGLLIVGLLLIALFPAMKLIEKVSGNRGSITKPTIQEVEDHDLGLKIEQKGITMKLLSTETLDNGTVVKSFAYAIVPSNATNQAVTATAQYVTGESCEDALQVEVEEETKTIRLTCLKAFNKQIEIEISSIANKKATAIVTIDYVKKLLSIEGKEEWQIVGTKENDTIETLDPMQFFDVEYSAYTKDKIYDFNFTWDDCTCDEGFETTGVFQTNFVMQLKERIEAGNYTFFTAEELWNLDPSNDMRAILKEKSALIYDADDPNQYLCYAITFLCENEETGLSGIVEMRFFFYFSAYDFTAYEIGVEGILAEQTTIDF